MGNFTRWLLLFAALAFGCGDDDGPRLEGTEPGDCDDGADNDADGDFDCDDSGCAGSPVCSAPEDAGRDAGDDAGMGDAGGGEDAMSCEGTVCDGTCVDDLSTNPSYCGACDVSCASNQACVASSCCADMPRPLDLLIVMDDSNGMTEEQAALVAELPALVRRLVSGDHDDDGTPETVGVDLHAGVVSTDLGVGGFVVPTCGMPVGDDGILLTAGNTSISGCDATYPQLHAVAPGADPAAATSSLSCVASAGTGGCGFQQTLEATLKALTPSSSALRFVGDTTGHADGANDGFLREDSLVAIVVVSNEDDCSAEDTDLYNSASTEYSDTELALRCGLRQDGLHAVARFVDGLDESVGASRLVFGVIGGVPSELETSPIATILADPRMTVEESETTPGRLETACSGASGSATPARRLLGTAQGLGAEGASLIVGSVCEDSYSGFTQRLVEAVGDRLGTPCPD